MFWIPRSQKTKFPWKLRNWISWETGKLRSHVPNSFQGHSRMGLNSTSLSRLTSQGIKTSWEDLQHNLKIQLLRFVWGQISLKLLASNCHHLPLQNPEWKMMSLLANSCIMRSRLHTSGNIERRRSGRSRKWGSRRHVRPKNWLSMKLWKNGKVRRLGSRGSSSSSRDGMGWCFGIHQDCGVKNLTL